VTILLTAYAVGCALAFPPALWLVAAAVRRDVFRMPWWGVVLAGAWIAAVWPWALYSFLC
jgi:hypothetical protein